MDVKIDRNTLVITVALERPRASRSGKTLVVASTRGNRRTGVKINGREIILGLNAYVRTENNDRGLQAAPVAIPRA